MMLDQKWGLYDLHPLRVYCKCILWELNDVVLVPDPQPVPRPLRVETKPSKNSSLSYNTEENKQGEHAVLQLCRSMNLPSLSNPPPPPPLSMPCGETLPGMSGNLPCLASQFAISALKFSCSYIQQEHFISSRVTTNTKRTK